MRMDGRRESGNVEDRRGSGGGSFGGMNTGGGSNLIGIILQVLLSLFLNNRRRGSNSGGSGKGGCGSTGGIMLIGLVLLGVYLLSGGPEWSGGLSDTDHGYTQQEQRAENYRGSDTEEELARFSKQVLAGTEDVWDSIFLTMGRQYQPPRLVLFSGSVNSGCGYASSQTGPFYCSADQCVYIDLSFFMNMRKTLGADGDFAYAYVIAHEVGHHVQYLLGDLSKIHRKMSSASSAESNRLSVRLELNADFYAGVWAYHDNRMFNSLEDGDIEEAINAAQKIGDDYLQKQAQGYTVPDAFTHGTSQQRMKWLKRGLTTGDLRLGDTFSVPYNSL